VILAIARALRSPPTAADRSDEAARPELLRRCHATRRHTASGHPSAIATSQKSRCYVQSDRTAHRYLFLARRHAGGRRARTTLTVSAPDRQVAEAGRYTPRVAATGLELTLPTRHSSGLVCALTRRSGDSRDIEMMRSVIVGPIECNRGCAEVRVVDIVGDRHGDRIAPRRGIRG
jgi:hypothetical protein